MYVDENGENRDFSSSTNFLSEFKSLFNTYYKVHNRYNAAVGFKILDVLNEFI